MRIGGSRGEGNGLRFNLATVMNNGMCVIAAGSTLYKKLAKQYTKLTVYSRARYTIIQQACK